MIMSATASDTTMKSGTATAMVSVRTTAITKAMIHYAISGKVMETS